MTLDDLARRAWLLLPEGVRTTSMTQPLREVYCSRVPRSDAISQSHREPLADQEGHRGGPRVVRTLDELDEMMERLDEAARVSDDELRRLFPTFVMELDLGLPDDPYSDQYRQRVFECFAYLRGRPYDPRDERTPIDPATCVSTPFPYATGSAETVGNTLMAIGHLIKTMALQPSSRVLEFGSGWGNVALPLAQMGHEVTALDIDPSMSSLVAARARRLGVEVETHTGDFMSASDLGRRFDAVLFVASFHHAFDHLSLLSRMDVLVRPGGKLVFAAEPISNALPAPWGLRLDGEALWQIRKRGWLEVGFQETYFVETLEKFGWTTTRNICHDTPFGVVYVAQRLSEHERTVGRDE